MIVLRSECQTGHTLMVTVSSRSERNHIRTKVVVDITYEARVYTLLSALANFSFHLYDFRSGGYSLWPGFILLGFCPDGVFVLICFVLISIGHYLELQDATSGGCLVVTSLQQTEC